MDTTRQSTYQRKKGERISCFFSRRQLLQEKGGGGGRKEGRKKQSNGLLAPGVSCCCCCGITSKLKKGGREGDTTPKPSPFLSSGMLAPISAAALVGSTRNFVLGESFFFLFFLASRLGKRKRRTHNLFTRECGSEAARPKQK